MSMDIHVDKTIYLDKSTQIGHLEHSVYYTCIGLPATAEQRAIHTYYTCIIMYACSAHAGD